MNKSTLSLALLSFAVAALLLVHSAPAFAGLLMYEPFGYSVSGGTSLNGQSGGGESGLAGSWATNAALGSGALPVDAGDVSLADPATSLTHPVLLEPAIGGRLDDSSGGRAARGFSGFSIPMASSGASAVRYVSALIEGSALIQFQGLAAGNTYVRSAFGIDDSGQFLVGMYNDPLKYQVSSAYSNGTYQADETYLLVAKIAPGAATAHSGWDTFSLKVFDSSMSGIGEPSSWDLYQEESSGVNLTTMTIGFYDGVAGQVDEIRIGNTWADVVATPEPSSLAILLGLGGLGLLGCQGRRRKN